MKPIQVNLLRGICLKPRQRRWCYRTMLAHVLLWSSLLIISVYFATKELCIVQQLHHQTRMQEQNFAQHYTVEGNILEQVKALRIDLNEVNEKAERIYTLSGERLDLPRLFKNIQDPLPPEAFLLSVRLEARSKRFYFELASPDIDGSAALEPRDLIETWQKNVFLSEGLKTIEQVDSRRYQMRSGPATVHAFSCALNNWGK